MPTLVFKLSDSQSLDFPLSGEYVRIGRNPANDIVIDNSWISSFHAEITFASDGSARIRDLSSSNGTSVNGVRVETSPLSNGDIVGFGQIDAIFDTDGNAAREAPAGDVRQRPGFAAASKSPPRISVPKNATVIPVPQTTLVPTVNAGSREVRPTPSIPQLAATQAVPVRAPITRADVPPAPVALPVSPEDSAKAVALKGEIFRAETTLRAARDELTKVNEALRTAQSEQAEGEKIRTDLHVEIGKLTQEVSALREALIVAQSSLESTRTMADATTRDYQLTVEKSRGELTQFEEKLQQARLTVQQTIANEDAGFAARRIAAQNEAQELTRQIDQRRSGLQEMEMTRQALVKDIARAEHTLVDQTAALTHAGARLSETETAFTHLIGKLTAKTAETTSIASRHAGLAAELQATESQLHDRAGQLAALEGKVSALAAATARLEQIQTATRTAATKLAGMEAEITQLTARQTVLAGAAARLATVETDVAAETVSDAVRQVKSELQAAGDTLARSRAAAAAAASAESSLKVLRAETAALESMRQGPVLTNLEKQATELKGLIEEREQKIRTMAEAPDPNWGTVHTITKSIIKQVDLLDDLITHLNGHSGSRESVEQLAIFRSNLMDILTEYDVSPYWFEPGYVIDVPTRKKIQIVESEPAIGAHSVIRQCYRPGYICTNGALGLQTLLRKAEVGIAAAP